MFKRTLVFVFVVALGAAAQTWQTIDTSGSTITVHAYKSGFLSSFGHNHTVRAPIARGRASVDSGAVELDIVTAALQVIDPEESPDKRMEIQNKMVSPDVLDAARYPSILFRSQAVTKTAEDAWHVAGTLTLHGQTRTVVMPVTRSGDVFRGKLKLLQTDYGIKPVSVAGGTIKVKDEVLVEFEIRLAP